MISAIFDKLRGAGRAQDRKSPGTPDRKRMVIIGSLGYSLVNFRLDLMRRFQANGYDVLALPDRPVHGFVFGKGEVAGSGLDERCSALAASLGVSDRLHLMGYRSPIEAAMAAMDVMLVTALEEPFGRTLIEAMHLGTPVVATEHGGNPEAIRAGETGFLVDPFDPSAFVAPVSRLLQDTGLTHEITDRAQTHVHDTLGTDSHVAQVSRIYEDIIFRSKRSVDAA